MVPHALRPLAGSHRLMPPSPRPWSRACLCASPPSCSRLLCHRARYPASKPRATSRPATPQRKDAVRHQSRQKQAMPMLGQPEGLSSFGFPFRFRLRPTDPRPLPARGPGVYVLEVVRTPNSATKPAQAWDRPSSGWPTAYSSRVLYGGRASRHRSCCGYRMESDNPKAEWPPHIHALAFLSPSTASRWWLGRVPMRRRAGPSSCGTPGACASCWNRLHRRCPV